MLFSRLCAIGIDEPCSQAYTIVNPSMNVLLVCMYILVSCDDCLGRPNSKQT